ncbi:MAG TPA: hypothetical protein VG318_00510 [Actinomycetota bacterium]|nr:hypothetical protein [Actinomycetota bacterium]
MSSRRPDAPPDGDAETPAPATKWPRWRISMLVGAILLLAASIAEAAVDDLPRWLYVIVFFTGYVFLSYGFFLALKERNKTRR